MIVAIAGRRIDAPGAPARFPVSNREFVRARLEQALRAMGATTVVASAACGADLLGHATALALGIRSRVVLPFDRDRFRETSVVDRPGDWGPLYDRVCDAALAAGDLVVLPDPAGDDVAYAATTRAILDEAGALSRTAPEVLVVWEGSSRGPGDLTAEFARDAKLRGWNVTSISTAR